MKTFMLLVLATALVVAAAGPSPAGKNIVQLAEGVKDLSTLVTALKAGNLTSTLSGKGPFTVFAPTNEAFAKLPTEVLKRLLDPKHIKELDAVLEYHVIAGAAIFSKDLKTFQKVKTLEGEDIQIVKAGRVIVNDNNTVTSPDNSASNGVVHIIDGVLIPPGAPAPTPAPGGGNHCWFRGVSCTELTNDLCRCGEIDAASRMPASLFEPQNAAALQRYKDITIDFYRYSVIANKTEVGPLEVGRCSEIGFKSVAGSESAPWAAGKYLMDPICKEMCHCAYSGFGTPTLPRCKDQPDDPKAGKFCSLCGPKYNQEISITLFNGACRNKDIAECVANEPYECYSGQCRHSPRGDLTKEGCERLCK